MFDLDIRNKSENLYSFIKRFSRKDFGGIRFHEDLYPTSHWIEEEASAYVISLIQRIPPAPIYLSEDNAGNLYVLDGVERVNILKEFLEDKVVLKTDLVFEEPYSKKWDLNGMTFSCLPTFLKNRIEDTFMQIYCLDALYKLPVEENKARALRLRELVNRKF